MSVWETAKADGAKDNAKTTIGWEFAQYLRLRRGLNQIVLRVFLRGLAASRFDRLGIVMSELPHAIDV